MNEIISDHKKSIIQKKRAFLKEKLLPRDGPFTNSQYNIVFNQFTDKTVEFSINIKEDENDFEYRLWDSLEILDDINSAFSIQNKEEEEPEDIDCEKKTISDADHEIWLHGNVNNAFAQGYESEHAKIVDKGWLSQLAVKYLNRPWMESELLEWILVDSLMFGEIVGFGETIKRYSPNGFLNINENYYASEGNIEEMQKMDIKNYFKNLGNKFLCFFVFPLLIAFLSYQYFSKEWATIGSVAYFCLLITFFFIRWVLRFLTRKWKMEEKNFEKSAELFDAMHGVYEILKGGTISPKYLREKLYETSKNGAVWPAAVFMVIDHAVNRNPAIWNSPESCKYYK